MSMSLVGNKKTKFLQNSLTKIDTFEESQNSVYGLGNEPTSLIAMSSKRKTSIEINKQGNSKQPYSIFQNTPQHIYSETLIPSSKEISNEKITTQGSEKSIRNVQSYTIKLGNRKVSLNGNKDQMRESIPLADQEDRLPQSIQYNLTPSRKSIKVLRSGQSSVASPKAQPNQAYFSLSKLATTENTPSDSGLIKRTSQRNFQNSEDQSIHQSPMFNLSKNSDNSSQSSLDNLSVIPRSLKQLHDSHQSLPAFETTQNKRIKSLDNLKDSFNRISALDNEPKRTDILLRQIQFSNLNEYSLPSSVQSPLDLLKKKPVKGVLKMGAQPLTPRDVTTLPLYQELISSTKGEQIKTERSGKQYFDDLNQNEHFESMQSEKDSDKSAREVDQEQESPQKSIIKRVIRNGQIVKQIRLVSRNSLPINSIFQKQFIRVEMQI